MAIQGHKWKAGDPSPNPKGRPPKARALTAILERAGSKTLDVADKRISGKRLIARMVWEAATTGRVTFPTGEALKVAADDWFDVVKWIYTHVDGPPKQGVEVTGAGGGGIAVNVRMADDLAGMTAEQRLALYAAILAESNEADTDGSHNSTTGAGAATAGE